MILTQVEVHSSHQEEFDMSSSEAKLTSSRARAERSSCLRNAQSVSVMCVGSLEVAEHSDDEWYPPTPPLYDVTDKLR